MTGGLPLAAAALSPPRVHLLHPGDLACADRGERFETLLGSCVAIVLTDPRRTVGAMCHVVHAGSPVAGNVRTTAYGDAALAQMSVMLRGRGIEPRLCTAWVVGGGNMFPRLAGVESAHCHVGDRNAAWALDRLAALGVRVLGHDLGGSTYRRLRWTVGPGAPEIHCVPV